MSVNFQNPCAMKNLFFLFCFCLLLLPFGMKAQEAADASKSGPMKPALLVIDIQNAFLPYMSEEDKKNALEVIKAAVAVFHKHNLPVIRIYHQDPKWTPAENSEEFQFPKSVEVADSDPKVIKHYANAFTGTNLDKVLRDLKVNTLFLCGLSATACVLATYFGGEEHDYQEFMLKGGLISSDSKRTEFIETTYDGISYTTMSFMLDKLH